MKLGETFKQNLGLNFKPVIDTKVKAATKSKPKDLTVDSTASTPKGKTEAFKDLMLYSMLTEKHGSTAIKDLNLENLFDKYPKGSFDMKGPLESRNIKYMADKLARKSPTTKALFAHGKEAVEKGKIKT